MNTLQKRRGMILLAIAFTAFVGAQAQEEPVATPDTAKEKVETITIPMSGGKMEIRFFTDNDSSKTGEEGGEKKPEKPELRKFWSGLDLGFNGYLNSEGGTTMPTGSEGFGINQGKSAYLGFNLYELGIPIYKNHVALITGLGIDYNNYRFKSNYSPFGTVDSNGRYLTRDYEQNRLRTFYATLPLMLGLDFSKPDKNGLHVAFGVVGGVRIGSHTKEKYNEGNEVIKTKTRGELDLNAFRLNAQARVGYGDFTLFASYALTEMFQANTGKPELYPFNFGISFGG